MRYLCQIIKKTTFSVSEDYYYHLFSFAHNKCTYNVQSRGAPTEYLEAGSNLQCKLFTVLLKTKATLLKDFL